MNAIGQCLLCARTGGYTLSDNPCPLFEDDLCGACREMEQLEPQILAAERLLSDLLQKRTETLVKINKSHDPILNKLPPEILAHIFKFVIAPWIKLEIESENQTESLDVDKGIEKMRIPFTPFKLGSVCSSWRKIAWSSPELWAFLSINLGKIDTIKHVQLVTEWIDRSGSLLLSLRLFINPSYTSFDANVPIRAIISSINQCSHRWGCLFLRIPACILDLICGSGTESMPLSRLFVDNTYRMTQEKPSDYKFQLKSSVPAPTEVSITRVWPRAVFISWERVTTLSLCNMDFSDTLGILQKVVCLESLTMKEIHIYPYTVPVMHTEICIPTLKVFSFYFKFAYVVTGKTVFEYLRFPNLESFIYDGVVERTTFEVLEQSLSSCSLKAFKVRFSALTPPMYIERLLLNQSSIQSLQIHNPSDDLIRSFAHLTTLDPPDAILLPNLCNLRFIYDWQTQLEEDCDWNSLMDLLNHPQRRSLKFLELVCMSTDHLDDIPEPKFRIEKHIIDQILAFRKAGITVKLSFRMYSPHHDPLDDAIANLDSPNSVD